jgi:hypothetical protein
MRFVSVPHLSLSLPLSLDYVLCPTYSSILYPTVPLSSLRLSPFPTGNCIKSRGSCQDLKPGPNYQLLLFERKEVNRCCWVDTASLEGGALQYRYISAHLAFCVLRVHRTTASVV